MYLEGEPYAASVLRDSMFAAEEPEVHLTINEIVQNQLSTLEVETFIQKLQYIGEKSELDPHCEWRIKSPRSILDNVSGRTIVDVSSSSIPDLIGFRFWLPCDSLSDFPDSMLALLHSILDEPTFQSSVRRVNVIEIEDHPHQKASVLLDVEGVGVEIQIKNLMMEKALNKTVYLMWQAKKSNRFEGLEFPFLFDKGSRDQLWNEICLTYHRSKGNFPYGHSCKCNGDCRLRKQALNIDAHAVKNRLLELGKEYDVAIVFT